MTRVLFHGGIQGFRGKIGNLIFRQLPEGNWWESVPQAEGETVIAEASDLPGNVTRCVLSYGHHCPLQGYRRLKRRGKFAPGTTESIICPVGARFPLSVGLPAGQRSGSLH